MTRRGVELTSLVGDVPREALFLYSRKLAKFDGENQLAAQRGKLEVWLALHSSVSQAAQGGGEKNMQSEHVSIAAECFNAGLCSLVAIALNPEAPEVGHFKQKFERQARTAWVRLGLAEHGASVFSGKTGEEKRSALQDKMPKYIEHRYGHLGRSYYDVGYLLGTLCFLLMAGESNHAKSLGSHCVTSVPRRVIRS